MVPTVFSSLLLALLLRSCVASISTSTQELCKTRYGGTSSSLVPTSSFTTSTTSYVTVRSSSTPTVTITPPMSTTYATVTDLSTVTQASITDTYSETETIVDTVTSPSTTGFTIFETSVVTITEPTPTSTVPTSPGFVYPSGAPTSVASEKKRARRYESSPRPQRRSPSIDKRTSGDAVQEANFDLAKGTLQRSPAQYPTSVLCTETIEVYSTSTVIGTAKPTTITAPASTITSTTTTVKTTTTSVYEVYTFVTFTVTQTLTEIPFVTTTTTTTTTETATLIPPTETFYAACDSQNIITPPAGQFFSGESYHPPSYQTNVQTPDPTSYECCVACITNPFCKVAEFLYDPGDNERKCTLDFGDSQTSCDAETVDITLEPGNIGNQSLSNGNCGGNFVFVTSEY